MTTMDEDLLKLLKSAYLYNEDGDLVDSFQYQTHDGQDFMSISKGKLRECLTTAWMMGFRHKLEEK